MARARTSRLTSGERGRKAAIVAASLAFHAVILGYMAFATIGDPRRYGEPTMSDDPLPVPPILVQLEPRLVLRGETARTRDASTPNPAMQPIPDAGTRLTEATGATGSVDAGDQTSPPSPPAPRFAPSAGAGAPAAAPPADVGSAQWRVRPETMGERMVRGGRTGTVGCASPNLLTAQERAICDQRFGERAATAAPIDGTGNPARDARFAREGARALAEYESRRRPLSGGSGLTLPDDCGGTNSGSNVGFGCAGSHLRPEFRQDRETALNDTLGADRNRAAARPLPRGDLPDDDD